MSRDVLQLRIELTAIEPAIWRRIQMPGDCTFWDLHVAIQNAMGWLDCHLHMFHVTDPTTGQPELIGLPDEEGLQEKDVVSGWKRMVNQTLSVAHSRLEYVYDFGDDWRHTVVLEEQLPSVPQVRYPRCIGGARACPPEDSGGVCGYRQLLAALADPHHEEHAGYREWVGEDYDSERFDPQSVKFEDPQQRWNYVFDDGEAVWDEGSPWVPGASVIEGEFTSEESAILLMTPFGSASPLILNTEHPDELFEQAPLVANSLCYLRLLAQREPLKLTQRGYLPRHFLAELFAAEAISETDYWIRRDQPPAKEADSRQASLLHLIGDKAGLTRKHHGKLHLTRRGRGFVESEGKTGALYRHLFEWHVTRYSWADEDRMPESPLLQAGFWYGLYLLQQYGDQKRPAEFYCDRYLDAFPVLIDDFAVSWRRTPEESFAHTCESRLLSKFASSFGLAFSEETDDVPSNPVRLVWAGPLLHEVIQWRCEEGVAAEGEAEGVVAGPWQGTGAQVEAGPDMVDPLAVAGTTVSTSEERPEIAEAPIEEVPSGAEFYDPAHVPDPDAWLELSDDDRIALVRDNHEPASTEPPNAILHATFHVVVETQLASADPPEVVETMARLLRQGLDRHDALHAIGSELARMMHTAVDHPSNTPDATQAYIAGLKQMTADKWRNAK